MATQNQALAIRLQAIDRMTGPLKAISNQASKLTSGMSRGQAELAEALQATEQRLQEVDTQAKKLQAFRDLKKQSQQTGDEIEQAQAQVQALAEQMRRTENPTRAMVRQFEQARNKVTRLKEAQRQESEQLERLRRDLRQAGLSTTDMANAQATLRQRTQAATTELEQQRRQMQRLNDIAEKRSQLREQAGDAGTMIGAGVATVAGAAGLAGISDSAMFAQQQAARMAAAQGLGREGAQVYRDMIAELHGDSSVQIEQTVESLEAVTAALGGLGNASASQIKAAVADVTGLSQAYQMNSAELMQVADQLVQNGLAGSIDEAFDLFAAGMSGINVTMRDELPEILNEYGTHFRALGLTGSESMALLASAAESGKWVLDKTGDALKEFSIRGSDMSKASAEAYELIGLSAGGMAGKIVKGGPAARDALQQTANALLALQDPTERANAAIALFGTPLEDISVDKIPEFLQAISKTSDGLSDVKGASDRLSDTLNNNATNALTRVQNALGSTLLDIFNRYEDTIIGVASSIGEFVKNNPQLIATLAIFGAILATLAVLGGGITLAISAFTGFMKIVAVAKTAMALFNLVMLANPIGLVVAAVAALVGILAVVAMKFEPVRKVAGAFFDWIGSKFGWIGDALGAVGDFFGFGDDGEEGKGAELAKLKPTELPETYQETLAKHGTGASSGTSGGAELASLPSIAAMTAQPVGGSVSIGQLDIHVNASEGTDAQQLAQMVRQEFENLIHKQQAQARGALYDG